MSYSILFLIYTYQAPSKVPPQPTRDQSTTTVPAPIPYVDTTRTPPPPIQLIHTLPSPLPNHPNMKKTPFPTQTVYPPTRAASPSTHRRYLFPAPHFPSHPAPRAPRTCPFALLSLPSNQSPSPPSPSRRETKRNATHVPRCLNKSLTSRPRRGRPQTSGSLPTHALRKMRAGASDARERCDA